MKGAAGPVAPIDGGLGIVVSALGAVPGGDGLLLVLFS